MTKPANKISAIITAVTRGTVYVSQIRDVADGSIKFTVAYSSGGTDWMSRHRFGNISQADAGAITLADWLDCEVRS